MNSIPFSLQFPQLLPRIADPLWFSADKPCDHEYELAKMEEEHQIYLTSIGQKGNEITPIGKMTSEHNDEEDEEEEEEDNDDDSEDNNDDDDDDLDGDDLIYGRDSPLDPFQ